MEISWENVVLLLSVLGFLLVFAMAYSLFNRSVKFDRMLANGEFKILFFILLFVLSVPLTVSGILFLLGNSGDLFYAEAANSKHNILWTMLYHCIDPGNISAAQEGWPRIVALMIAVFGAIFVNGVLVSSIVSIFERHINKWEKGLARYPQLLKKKNCIVIIGSNELIPNLIKQLFERKEAIDYVVVQTNRSIESFRKYLASFLSAEDEKRVILYSGEPTSMDDIADLRLEYAREVFVLGNSLEDESSIVNCDAQNMRCLQIIADAMRKSNVQNHKLICRVMFEHATSFSIFQFADISNQISSIIDFRPFNYYELWSQRVFVNRNLSFADDISGFLPLEGSQPIVEESDDFVHLVIVGMSKMGVSMATEAAHLSHYPNFDRDTNLKTRITFIDSRCDKEMLLFKARFAELFYLSKWAYTDSVGKSDIYRTVEWKNEDFYEKNSYLGKDFIDVEWEFIKGGIESSEIHSYLKDAVNNPHARFTLAICLPQDHQSVAASLYLPDEVYEKAVQVLVYQRHSDSLINSIALNNNENLYYKRLKPFGMITDAYDDTLIETTQYIANVLGDKYYEMYQKINKQNNIEKKGRTDTRGKSKAAKQWSNIYNANTIWSKLRSIQYKGTDNIPEDKVKQLARTEHNRWVMEQLLMRFRALTKEEQENVLKGTLDKDALKGDKMAHLDICSNDRLIEIDGIGCQYDEGLIQIIPSILTEINQSK